MGHTPRHGLEVGNKKIDPKIAYRRGKGISRFLLLHKLFATCVRHLETDRDRPTSFFDTDTNTDILKFFFSDIWSVADSLFTTDIDILKFAYRYIFRYFNKVFSVKLVGITYTSLVHFSSNINQYKCVYINAKIAQQCCIKARHKKICWTNSNKIQRFLRNQDDFGTNCAVDKRTKISVNISAGIRISADYNQKGKYCPIILVGRYISRSLIYTFVTCK